MKIRRFKTDDAKEVSDIVRENLLEINSKDYSFEEMKNKAAFFTGAKIKERAENGHMYVACEGEKIVATGTVSEYWGNKRECMLLTVFVLVSHHGRGIVKKIIKTLENDEIFKRAERAEVCASITACGFYEKCGYEYKNGIKISDGEGHYRMEKKKMGKR